MTEPETTDHVLTPKDITRELRQSRALKHRARHGAAVMPPDPDPDPEVEPVPVPFECPYKVVSFYTTGTSYAQEIKKLERSLLEHQLPYHFFACEPRGLGAEI